MTRTHPNPYHISLMAGLAALLGLLLSITAWAAPEAIGTLAEARGRVEINGVPASAGAELRLGMRVVTGADGRAVLKFLDDQTISLNPGSVFWIKNYRYAKGKPQDNRSTMELLKGGMRFISGTMAKENPEAIRIDTPVATIGIRGTEFTAVLGSLCLLVHQGAVAVTAAGKTVIAEADQMVFVADADTPPRLVPASELRAPCAPPREAGGAPPLVAGCTCRALLAVAPAGGAATAGGIPSAAMAAAAAAIGAAVLIPQTNQDEPDASP